MMEENSSTIETTQTGLSNHDGWQQASRENPAYAHGVFAPLMSFQFILSYGESLH